MEINPNRSVDVTAAAAGASKSRGAAARVDGDDEETSFPGSNSLNAALEATPDTRAEVVARAEKLVASASYPPPEMLQKIANLLAQSIFAND